LDSSLLATSNLLLSLMSPDDLALLAPDLEKITLTRRQVLTAPGQQIEHVYFLEGGVASVVSNSADAVMTEVGVFGREGLSSISVLLGSDRSPHETFLQVDGTSAYRIGVDRFRAAIAESPRLKDLLLRYVQTFLIQVANSVASNAHSRIEARLARWLLMCHDRIDGDDVHLTHEFMSMMVAAQRTGVTLTLHILEGAGIIQSQRARITILDRDKLEALAGDSYGQPEAEYRRLIGPMGRGQVTGSHRFSIENSTNTREERG
jgi:CRP-like cAMP-binding protein